MPIPERFLDELMARTDIVDLVSESVRLTKKGSSYWGCCPFHSEKTPSFHVVPDRQIYKCFGCGKGGGAINFVMELENLSFRDAVAVLAKRAGMTMPESFGGSPDAQKRREKMLELNRQAALAFHRWLYAPEGAHGWTISAEGGCPPAPSPGSAWALPRTAGTPSSRRWPSRAMTSGTCWTRAWPSATKMAASMTGSAIGSSSPSSTCGGASSALEGG